MAIDFSQIQQQIVDRAQSRLTEEAQRPGEVDPSRGAARFEQLMESPDGGADGPEVSEAANPSLDQTPPAGRVADPGAPAAVGDRILANLHLGSPRTLDLAGTEATGPVGAKPGIDIGDSADRLAMQIKVAEIKAEAGLSAAAVQKASQGMDTLLKSQ